MNHYLVVFDRSKGAIGPRTGRVELLRAAQNVLRQLEWIREQDKAATVGLE
ncbi:MAG: hypothetical protein ACREOE_16685 [Gemmatimonadales bacterium]